jgi:hypothetical protein
LMALARSLAMIVAGHILSAALRKLRERQRR